MKKTTLILTLGLVAILSSTGCHKKPVGVTDIPGMRNPSMNTSGIDSGGKLETPRAMPEPGGIAAANDITGPYASTFNGPHDEDRSKFAADIVHFDTDSAVIKKSDLSKLDDVANYFKSNQSKEALQIEGNCDERGTEQYNLSLGDKRALAVREYLAGAGVDPQRIKTVSYGKAKPIDSGHDASAWSKNRRAECVLLIPK